MLLINDFNDKVKTSPHQYYNRKYSTSNVCLTNKNSCLNNQMKLKEQKQLIKQTYNTHTYYVS